MKTAEKKQPMRESRILLIAFGALGVICCCMAGTVVWSMRRLGNQVQNMAEGNPTSVAQVMEKIADFETPPGYRPMAMNLIVYDTLYLTPDSDPGPTIMLMQYRTLSSVNREQLEEGLRQAAEQQNSQPGLSMQVVDSFETEIRGETVTVTVSEGNFEGFVMRQWLTIFEGNSGPVVMMVQGPAETWDDAMLMDFIASIK